MSGIFIVGTDTGVGKTVVGAGLAGIFREEGVNVGVMKPVATAGVSFQERLISPDVLFMCAAARLPVEAELVNPYCYELPAAPLVASRGQEPVSVHVIKECFATLRKRHSIIVVEGIGGLLVPLSDVLMLPGLISELDVPVLVVASASLGTINHSLLTIQCARSAGLNVIGLVMNRASRRAASTIGLVEETNPSIVSKLGNVLFLGTVEEGTGIDVDACRLGNTVEIVRRGVDWRKILNLIRKA